ncbi:MAG TPA: amidohydrolase family protein [Anaerolineae bacterium]|nr:amidohydrolase family protein [Anaerolineae bacterium]
MANSLVLIEGAKIRAIGDADRASIPENAVVLDVSGMTVLPGLMDLHTHLCFVPNPDPWVAATDDLLAPESWATLWGVAHARAALHAGFTTVRDAFNHHGQTGALALARAVEAGLVQGPRIFAAGYAGVTSTEVDIRIPSWIPRPYGYTADGPWELRKRVRELIRDGYTWIKTFTSGGRVSGGQEEDVWYTTHTLEELQALVDEAHNYGVGVMVHASTRAAIKLALDAGADTIEHGWPLDDELIEQMLKQNAVLVPTISVYSERGFLREQVQPALIARAKNQYQKRMDSFRRAYQAGVRIACGTDITPSMPTMRFGENAFELTMMVRQGMAARDAIVAATSTSAAVLGIQHEVGTLAAGMTADILVVEGDPLADITVLERCVRYVIKEGRIEFEAKARKASPAN